MVLTIKIFTTHSFKATVMQNPLTKIAQFKITKCRIQTQGSRINQATMRIKVELQ
jgi:hypothetical protein